MRVVLKPVCLDELFYELERHPEALPMAGGTDLLIRLRKETAPNDRPLLLLENVSELQGVSDTGREISIGAATTLNRLIADPLVRHHAPLLIQAAQTIGGPSVRNMATLGGNISTASPAGDSLPALFVLGARVELVSPREKRWLPITEFVAGPSCTQLRQCEIITRILVPYTENLPCQMFEKIGLRRALAVAITSFAGMMRLSGDGVVEDARFAWGSVAPTALRLPEVEKKLIGVQLNNDIIREAGEYIRQSVSPIDDIRATAEYRRSVAGNLLVRFLEEHNG